MVSGLRVSIDPAPVVEFAQLFSLFHHTLDHVLAPFSDDEEALLQFQERFPNPDHRPLFIPPHEEDEIPSAVSLSPIVFNIEVAAESSKLKVLVVEELFGFAR